MSQKHCWCGNQKLKPFSPDYHQCDQCSTLVSQKGLQAAETLVKNDSTDFYGKEYWLSHMQNDLGFPNIHQRARNDLPERCLHWFKTLIRYKLPPAKTLELGCAHGGFIALLKQAGYEASGLEMSPWVVDFARQTFDIPVQLGTLESQTLAPHSLDVIILMDVVEHLPFPQETLKHCFNFIKDDGLIMIQMPHYQKEKSYRHMLRTNDPFLTMLRADEHLHLFSRHSAQQLLNLACGNKVYTAFETAIFSNYDMFLFASKQPITTISPDKLNHWLTHSPQTRLLQMMLDLADQRDTATNKLMNDPIRKIIKLMLKPYTRLKAKYTSCAS